MVFPKLISIHLKQVINQYLGQAIKKYRSKALKQRARSYAFLYIPVLAIVLFTCAMGLILWTLNYQDKNQQQYTLYRETAFAKQRILLRFAANEDAILELSREISNSANRSQYPESFLKLSTKLIQDSPEILQLRWLDSRQNRIATLPNNPSFQSGQREFRLNLYWIQN